MRVYDLMQPFLIVGFEVDESVQNSSTLALGREGISQILQSDHIVFEEYFVPTDTIQIR